MKEAPCPAAPPHSPPALPCPAPPRSENLRADEGAQYDQVIEINLSELEPQVNGPFTPDLANPLSKLADNARREGWPLEVSGERRGPAPCLPGRASWWPAAAPCCCAQGQHACRPRAAPPCPALPSPLPPPQPA